mgnify:CR=1 FL=1
MNRCIISFYEFINSLRYQRFFIGLIILFAVSVYNEKQTMTIDFETAQYQIQYISNFQLQLLLIR